MSRAPVSAVIPAFNAGRWIARAIASVRAQTLQPEEIIVVDDGSTDATAAIARGLGARVISQANVGCGGARQTGIEAARCPWIALLDADDEWLPEKLALQLNALQRDSSAVVSATDFTRIDADGSERRAWLRNHGGYLATERTRVDDLVYRLARSELAPALIEGYFLSNSSLVLTTEFARAIPFKRSAELTSNKLCHEGEDIEWALRALRSTDVLMLELPLVRSHSVAGSLSSNFGRMRYGDAITYERVLSSPDEYAKGLEPHISRHRPRKYSESAREFLRRGDVAHARAAARQAFRARPSVTTASLLAVTCALSNPAGAWSIERARSTWKRFLKPALRRDRAA